MPLGRAYQFSSLTPQSTRGWYAPIGEGLRELGYHVWIDEEAIALGDRLTSVIERAVSAADFLVLFLSKAALLSNWVDEEWRTKFEEQLSAGDVRVIPVLVEECDLPPTLRGRLFLRLSDRREMLFHGAKEIDGAVQAHLARRGARSKIEPLAAPRVVANVAGELQRALDRPGARSSDQLDAVLFARAAGMKRYDRGDVDSAIDIYRAIVDTLRSSTIHHRVDILSSAAAAFGLSVDRLADSSRDEWVLRMLVDQGVELLQALAIADDFVRWQSVTAGHSLTSDYWWPFEPLRYAMEDRADKVEHLSTGVLNELIRWCITQVREQLVTRLDGVLPEVHAAVVLRILRWPGLSDNLPRPGESSTERRSWRSSGSKTVSNEVELLWDIYNLNMTSFDFFFGLDMVEIRERMLSEGSAAAFDLALVYRGYPRDEAYWSDPSALPKSKSRWE